jgi:hypothetical protein
VRDPAKNETLVENDIFEITRKRYEGGEREAQEHAVALARKLAPCKRSRAKRAAISAASITWLEDRLLDMLRDSYNAWRENTARYGRGVYPEPRLSTALVVKDIAQIGGRPDDLDVVSKRFYTIVVAALGRLKKRGLVVTSEGLDYANKPSRLWEPA